MLAAGFPRRRGARVEVYRNATSAMCLPGNNVVSDRMDVQPACVSARARLVEAPITDEIEAPNPSVARSTALMSASTAASRITGFVRTWAMAVALGVTVTGAVGIPIASSYNLANNLPNMVYELLAGGVLSAMFVPIFMERMRRDGKDGAYHAANSLYSIILVVLGAVALVGTLWPQPFVLTQTFTVSPDKSQLAVYFFRFFAVQIVFYGFCAVTTGILNSQRKFFAPAIGPLVNNVVVIIALLGFYLPLHESRPDLAVVALGVGTTLGVVSLLVTQLPTLFGLGFRFRWSWDLSDPTLRKLLRKSIPIVGYVAVNLVAVTFRNAFATRAFLDGSAALVYAWMWYQLPYGVLAVAYITAIFPELSDMAVKQDWTAFKTTFSRALRVMTLLILPMAAMLVVLSVPLVKLYRVGAFPADAVPLVAGVLSAWALGLLSFSLYMLTLRAFYAQQDSLTPTITNALLAVVHIGLYWGLTSVTAWGDWRLIGIPAADAVFFTIHTAVLLFILRRRRGGLDGRHVAFTMLRVLAATVAGATVAWAVVRFTPGLTASRLGFLLQLAAGGTLGLVTTYGLAALMRVDELREGVAMLQRTVARFMPGRVGA
jgi:putative peptidoglycan lipid II flippase